MVKYQDVIQEHFDITDDYTRSTLLSIDEADKNTVMDSLASKLYTAIIDKVDDIDFGSIPESKGDITAIENYNEMVECIGVITNILNQYRQDLKLVNTITAAIENVKQRKDTFTKAFTLQVNMVELLYNTIVLSIVSSVSLIIATSIEFVKDAGDQDFSIKFDKVAYVKTKDNLLFQNLEKFNRACSSGEMDRSIDHIFTNASKQLLGVDPLTAVGAIAVIGIIANIIPITRELVYFFYHSRQNVSDYFDIQADLLQINAQYVKNNPISNKSLADRNTISKKQNDIALRFRKISNAFAIDAKQADSKASKDAKVSNKKYNLKDVTTQKLDSAPEEPASTTVGGNTSSIF